MDIDPTVYPSRVFARLLAHTQLTADITGCPITISVQRLGEVAYDQNVIPGGEPQLPSTSSSHPTLGLRFNLSASLHSAPSSNSASPIHPLNDAIVDSSSQARDSQGIDQALFEDVAKTVFSPNRYPDLYRSCGTRAAAAELEVKVATEIVATYKQIMDNRDCSTVQGLNDLL